MQGREHIHLPRGHSFRVLRWTESVRDVEALFPPEAATRVKGAGEHWHYHTEMELTLFTSGQGTRFVGDHIAPFASGDLVLLGEKLPHYWHARGVSSGLSVQWDFPNSHPFWTFPETHALSSLFKTAARGIRFTGRTATSLSGALHNIARASGPERLAFLFRLFAIMADAPVGDWELLSNHEFALPTGSSHQQAIDEALRFLLANYRHEVRLDEVLQLTGMSKPTFSREFKKHAGMTFSDVLLQVRLQAACRELAETTRPVLEIAMACGFSQISLFNRLFRRERHCSPTGFRKLKQAKAESQSTSICGQENRRKP